MKAATCQARGSRHRPRTASCVSLTTDLICMIHDCGQRRRQRPKRQRSCPRAAEGVHHRHGGRCGDRSSRQVAIIEARHQPDLIWKVTFHDRRKENVENSDRGTDKICPANNAGDVPNPRMAVPTVSTISAKSKARAIPKRWDSSAAAGPNTRSRGRGSSSGCSRRKPSGRWRASLGRTAATLVVRSRIFSAIKIN